MTNFQKRIGELLRYVVFKSFIIFPIEYSAYLFFKLRHSLKISEGKKNVLFIIPWMVVGGAEKSVLNIAEKVAGEKFSLHVIITNPIENSLAWSSKFKECFQNVVVPNVKTISLYYETNNLYTRLICYKYFQYLIRKLNVELVVISNSRLGADYLPKLKSRFAKVKVVDIIHSEVPFPYPQELSASYVETRICISQYLKNYIGNMYKNFGIDENYTKRLTVIYNGVDTKKYVSNPFLKGKFRERYAISSNEKIIAFIGRFAPEKNPSLFVKIAKVMSMRFPNEFRFVMAGNGPELVVIREMIKSYGLENLFVLLGEIENVVELLNDTYMLLLVSKGEGIPFVILEAMSMSVPVMSTNVGGIGEVVENNLNGFLIDPDEDVVDLFVSKMSDLIEEKVSYSVIANKARDTIVSRFSLETMGSKYLKLLNELTEN